MLLRRQSTQRGPQRLECRRVGLDLTHGGGEREELGIQLEGTEGHA